MTQKQFRNSCIFCGNDNVNKEHIFPVWLGEIFDVQEKRTPLIRKRITEYPTLDIENFCKTSGRPITSFQIKKFCEGCNGGWMSQLEEKTKRIYLKIKNCLLWLRLSDEEIDTLIAWSVLKTIEWELTSEETSSIPKSEIEYFYKHRTPPPNWMIRIGHYENNDASNRPRQLHIAYLLGEDLAPNAEKHFNCQSTSFCIPPLFIHTISHSSDLSEHFSKAYKNDENYTIKIWPKQQAFRHNFKSLPKIKDEVALFLNQTMGDIVDRDMKNIHHRLTYIPPNIETRNKKPRT